MDKLEKVQAFAKEMHDECGYDYHILSVVKNSIYLAKIVNANLEVVQVAAYLHDLGVSRKIAGEGFSRAENDHHILGAEEARKFLLTLDYSEEFIEKVCNCILTHRGRKGTPPITIEQKVIANADAMAHFDTFLDLFEFFVGKTSNSFEEGVNEIYDKMKRDWELKLTLVEAREKIKPKYEAVMLILESMKEFMQK